MNILILPIIATAALPTPHFSPGLPLPVPKFSRLIPVVALQPVRKVDRTMQLDSRGRLIRLPGPKNWYRCPQCGSSTDLMYLGQHVRGTHRVSNAMINKVGYQNLSVYHDNLHNVARRAPPAAKPKPVQCATPIQGRRYVFPAVRQFFGGG